MGGKETAEGENGRILFNELSLVLIQLATIENSRYRFYVSHTVFVRLGAKKKYLSKAMQK